jgi:hypothetical protein
MNEYGRLDRNAFQLGHEAASLAVSIGEERITCRGMDDKLGCTVRVPQREKRKGFGNFSTWGMGNGVSGWTGALQGTESWEGGLPFWKEPTSEDDARADIVRSEGAAIVRTLRKRC